MKIISKGVGYPNYVVAEGEHGVCIYQKLAGKYEHMRCDVGDAEAIDTYADELEEEMRCMMAQEEFNG